MHATNIVIPPTNDVCLVINTLLSWAWDTFHTTVLTRACICEQKCTEGAYSTGFVCDRCRGDFDVSVVGSLSEFVWGHGAFYVVA